MADFTYANAIQLVSLLFVGLGSLLGVWWRMEQRIRAVETKASDEVRSVEKQFADYKLEVAQEYATWNTVKDIQTGLVNRMDSMSARLETMPDVVVERIMKFLNLKHMNS
jgi:hypothetical protein